MSSLTKLTPFRLSVNKSSSEIIELLQHDHGSHHQRPLNLQFHCLIDYQHNYMQAYNPSFIFTISSSASVEPLKPVGKNPTKYHISHSQNEILNNRMYY